MKTCLVYRSTDILVHLEVSIDGKTISIFKGTPQREEIDLIAQFPMEEVWDMIKDNLSVIDVGHLSNPGLFRRKGEALAANLYTTNLYLKGRDQDAI